MPFIGMALAYRLSDVEMLLRLRPFPLATWTDDL